MAIYKLDYFFEQRKNGWSETFYTDVPTVAIAIGGAKGTIAARVALLGGVVGDGSSPKMTEIRASNVAIQRDSVIYRLSPADGVPSNPLGGADNPNLCIDVRFDSGDLYRRSLSLRGQPDSLVTNNGIYVPSPLWERLFQFWRTLLLEHFGIYAITKPPEVPVALIAGVIFPPPVGVNIVTTVPHGLADQDSVRIVRIPGIKGVQGNWRIRVVDATTFELLGATGTGRYTGGGQYYKRVPIVKFFSEMQIIGASHRITGRPFDSPRGRRRHRVRASSL